MPSIFRGIFACRSVIKHAMPVLPVSVRLVRLDILLCFHLPSEGRTHTRVCVAQPDRNRQNRHHQADDPNSDLQAASKASHKLHAFGSGVRPANTHESRQRARRLSPPYGIIVAVTANEEIPSMDQPPASVSAATRQSDRAALRRAIAHIEADHRALMRRLSCAL